MRIGYFDGAEGEADYLRRQGHDVQRYAKSLAFDALIYNQSFQPETFGAGALPLAAPIFLLNTKNLTNDEIARQIMTREDSDLFR